MSIRTMLLSVVAAAWVGGCGRGDERAPVSTVRDSAGVRIVENVVPVWKEAERWRLAESPLLEIRGDGENAEEMPLDPASVFRHGADIIVADGLSVGHHRILVYDAAGAFVRSMGRAGQGPCEFTQLWWAAPYRGDSIAAYDYDDHDISIFAADGSCGRVVRLPQWEPPRERGTWSFSPGADGVFADGSFLTQPAGFLDVSGGPGPAWYRHSFLRVVPEGETYDSLGLFEISQAYWTGTITDDYPFGAHGNRVAATDGFHYGRGDSFEIRRYTLDGRLQMLVRRAFEPQPLTPADRQTYIDSYVEMIRNAGYGHGGDENARRARLRLEAATFAPTRPAFSKFLVDDQGNLWVQEYRTSLARDAAGQLPAVRWSVFDADGAWLGDVDVPGRFEPLTITSGEVLGAWKEESGIAHVQVYELIRAN